MISRRRFFWLLLVGGVALPRAAAFADDGGDDGGGNDSNGEGGGGDDHNVDDGASNEQDRALEAVKNNNAASLTEILAIVQKEYQGEIVHVSLEGSGQSLVYGIRLLDKSSRLIEIHINARSRAIVLEKGV